MQDLKQIFNNKAVQKTFFVANLIGGSLGILSGAWQLANNGPGVIAGFVGGAVGLGIGIAGLRLSARHKEQKPQ